MTNIIKNFSWYPFNTDQKNLLAKCGYKKHAEIVLSPNLDMDTIREEIIGYDFSVSYEVPLFNVLRVLKSYWSKYIIVWDYILKQKSFAVKGVSIFEPACDFRLVALLHMTPTVETDIKTGVEFPYGEEENTL